MNRSRLTLAVLGVLSLLAAVVTARAGVANALSVDWLVSTMGNDYYFVGVIAALALLAGAVSVLSGRNSNLHQAEMPNPERPFEAPTPGDEFDRYVCSWRASVPVVGWRHREGVRDRLRRTAAETITRTRNCSLDEATRRIDDGTWTDDPWAATFLGENGGRLTVRDRLSAVLDRDPWFPRGARRSIAGIVALSEDRTRGAVAELPVDAEGSGEGPEATAETDVADDSGPGDGREENRPGSSELGEPGPGEVLRERGSRIDGRGDD